MENQPLNALPNPIRVEKHELGIANNTQIELEPDPQKTKLTFNRVNDEVIMNLSITFKPQPGKIEFGPEDIVAESVAAFDLTDPAKNFYESGQFNKLFLSTDKAAGITISSAKGDFRLITNADKKLSGGSFLPFNSDL